MSSVNGIFTEAMLEEAAIEILESLGYDYAFGPDISLGGDYEERKDYREVILSSRVKDALFKINRDLPSEALEEAYRQLITFNSPMLEENNRYFHQLMTEGIEVSFNEGGHIRTKRAYVIDFENMSNNEFVVINQFTIIENEERRPFYTVGIGHSLGGISYTFRLHCHIHLCMLVPNTPCPLLTLVGCYHPLYLPLCTPVKVL